MKRWVMAAMVLVAALMIPEVSWAPVVGTYTLTLPSDAHTVMGDSTATLVFNMANDPGSTRNIRFIRMDFDPSVYYVSSSSVAPAGWYIGTISNTGSSARITFLAITDDLAPGENADFTVVLNGSGDGPITADVNDMTDTLTGMLVKDNPWGNRTFTGTPPAWPRHSLAVSYSAVPPSVGIGDPITLLALVTNRSTVTQSSVQPTGITVSGTGGATYSSGPVPASATLDPGENQVFTYSFTAVSSGTAVFTGSAFNGTGLVTAYPAASNTVVIGDFTATMDISSASIISGQQVTVTMTVKNNGSGVLAGITPSISTSGTASLALDSGPTPAAIGNLPAGTTGIFEWVYTVSGSPGDTYGFTGQATSTTLTTNTAVSPTGSVAVYAVVPSPATVASGATNVSLNFTVYNNGSSGVRQVRITTPPGSSYTGASAPPGWSIQTGGNPVRVRFRNTSNPIPVGSNATFTLNFSSVPVVSSPSNFNFLVEVWDQFTWLNGRPTASLESIVTIVPYTMSLVCTSPYSPLPIADGIQYYDLSATLTGQSGPVSGAPVLFTTTAGTLASGTVVTDGAGLAADVLTGPLSTTSVSASVSAQYLGASASALCVFSAYPGLTLDYVPGTMGPTSATAGSTGIVFAVSVINAGSAGIDLDEGATYFNFDDSTVGGSSTYQAYLDISNPVVIAAGNTAVLTFLAADVDAAFNPGSFLPQLFLDNGISSGTRPVTDAVTITGGGAGAPVTIIRWRESIQ